jgi:hypothetical protein
MQRAFKCAGLLLVLFATQAFGQVRVDARLEKGRYLEGEPVVIVVDILNVGDEAVGYSTCDGNVNLTVAGAERRVPPNIFGCFSGMGISGGGCAIDHPPLLPPGQSTSFRYLLKEYNLKPGQYSLTASGKAGVRWKYYPSYPPNVPPSSTPKHKETDPVPGAQFERTLSLNIAPATEDDLKRAFAPLVSDADAVDPLRRNEARAAIVESAPQFLGSLIARFAVDDPFRLPAIDALGRIATVGSRSQLKNLFERSHDLHRSSIVLALAGVGHGDDTEFLAGVLQDAAADDQSRRYAALGIGHIGGDQAVRYLERALPTAPPEIRSDIAISLGNTRSRMAVPVLIGMFSNNPARNSVCSGLRTLTHLAWCDGTADDPAAKRRQWQRRWNENGSTARIYGPDNCPEDPRRASDVVNAVPIVEASKESAPPVVTSVRPLIASPNAVIALSGYALGAEDSSAIRVLFMQGDVAQVARISGGGRVVSRDPNGGAQYMDMEVPEMITPGRWQIVVDVKGRRSAPVTIDISAGGPVVLTRVSPERPHPSQGVLLATRTPAQVGDHVELIDGRGAVWRIGTGVSSLGVSFTLPDDVAEGEATIRVGRTQNGEDRFSTPLKFVVTSGPLPLKGLAAAMMKSVGPGQWTDLVTDNEVEFEIRRSDRIEVEFRQGDVVVITQATGPDSVHVQVPAGVALGSVSVRTRTGIEQTESEWSAPTTFRALERPVAPSISSVEAGPVRNLVWWAGNAAPAFVQTKPGEALVLRGHFPVARAADLRVQLRGQREALDLVPTDVDGGVRVVVPGEPAPGDWQLMIGTVDGLTPLQGITTVRVM